MTRRRSLFAGWVACLAVAAVCTIAAQRPAVTIIEGATIVDAVSAAAMTDAIIEIQGGIIRYVGPRTGLSVPPAATRVDLTGKTIIPGIFNVHTHLNGGMPPADGAVMPRGGQIELDADRYLYYGVTHVLSLGLDGDAMDAYQKEQAAGHTTGARVYFAGFGLSAPGGWSANTSLYRPANAEQAREAVRAQAARRVNAIKFWVDDDHGKLPKLGPEIYGAIIDEAHQHGLEAFCHMFRLDDSKELMRRNLDVLAHSVRDRELDAEFVRLAVAHHTTLIPALVGHSSVFTFATRPAFLDDPDLQRIYPASVIATAGSKATQDAVAANPNVPTVRHEVAIGMKNVRIAADGGVQLALGTDTGPGTVFMGLADHLEMEMLVESGLTPMQALQAATINGARVLKLDRDYGSISNGKRADFVVLDANPLADIRNTRRISAVWVSGKPVDRQALAAGTAAP